MSPAPAARTIRGSPETAARIRGSSCPASATTSVQPGSARTALRTTLGICSAPPPRVAHRPDTTPAGIHSGWNRPSRTHCWRQVQPWAVQIRYSSLYSSSSGTAGWSTPRSTHARVEGSEIPSRWKARSISAGDSGWIRWPPNASAIRPASSASRRGGPPTGDGSPSRSTSSSSWTSARQGSPSTPISAATRAPADSAATRSRNRAGCGTVSMRACWSAYTRISAWSGSNPAAAGGARSNSSPCPLPGGTAARGGGSGGTGAPASRAQPAASDRGCPHRPSAPSSSASVSSRS